MKQSIVGALISPCCGSSLDLEEESREGDDIMEGFLHCSCRLAYPIIRGVPRLLPPALLDELPRDYPEFYRTHAAAGSVASPTRTASEKDAELRRRTQEAFGHEWTWSADYSADNLADWLPQDRTIAELFGGKIGLEVGCGAGRHAALVSSMAGEHFAIDVSRAVDVAFARNRHRGNCHVVQADAFGLPFRDGSFDYVFCLGVLQHMHDPREGFRHLATKPRAGGILVVNVYQSSRPVMIFALEAVRKVTTRMPHAVLSKASFLAGLLDYGLLILPWKHIAPTRAGRLLGPAIPRRIKEYARHDFQTCYTDWFDRLSCPVKLHFGQEDLAEWYREAGYEGITVEPYWKAFWNGYGRRTAERPDASIG